MLKRIHLFVFLGIISHQVFSQNKFEHFDFSDVDLFARSVKYDNDLYQMTKDLTSPLSKDVFKVRAIFIWIAENIKYDYKLYNSDKEREGPPCEDVLDCTDIITQWENKYLKKILKQKQAICDGYSRLFKRMCDIAGIESEVVTGYARSHSWQIGSSFNVNHGWNAVKLDSAWYFLDVTWAAGYCVEDPDDGKLTKFVKKYNEYYWLTPPKKLNRNHYPEKGKWAYEDNFTRDKFVKNPYYVEYILDKIDMEKPNTGILEVCYGDTIHFKFTYDRFIDKIQINSNIYSNPKVYYEEKTTNGKKKIVTDTMALKKQQYIIPRRKGNEYEFEYAVTSESLYYLDLLFNHYMVMKFRVKVKTD